VILLVPSALLAGLLVAICLNALNFASAVCVAFAFVAATVAAVLAFIMPWVMFSDGDTLWWALQVILISALSPSLILIFGAMLTRKVFHG
jgi:hypothetical protein